MSRSSYRSRAFAAITRIHFIAIFALLCAAPAALAVIAIGPVMSATKDDGVASNSFKLPGDTINYTVTISNTGTGDATGVSFDDIVDANTMLTGAVTATPLANNDTYP